MDPAGFHTRHVWVELSSECFVLARDVCKSTFQAMSVCSKWEYLEGPEWIFSVFMHFYEVLDGFPNFLECFDPLCPLRPAAGRPLFSGGIHLALAAPCRLCSGHVLWHPLCYL